MSSVKTKLDQEQIEQLNLLGRKMPKNTPENRAAFRKWKEDVCIFLFENYVHLPDSSTTIEGDCHLEARITAVEEFCKGIKSFDPEKGNLANYALRSLKINKTEAYSDQGRKPDEPETTSLTVTDEDGENKELDIPSDESPEARLLEAAYTSQMTAMILNFWGLYNGKKGSEKRRIYFPMWYSEKTKYLQEKGCEWENKADVLRALNFEYLDFFLDRDFSLQAEQSWGNFADADLNEQIAVASSDTPIKAEWSDGGWLAAEVPKHYLYESGRTKSICSDSTISDQRKNYLRELEGLLFEQGLLEKKRFQAKKGKGDRENEQTPVNP